MEPDADPDRRRSAALATMLDRFPAAQERFNRAFGLRLPRHLAVFAACWVSLDDSERWAMEELGLRPWGVTELLLRPGGLDRVDGDPRLHGRSRRDPPELVTVLSGDTDGLRFGLWYDEPAALPGFVAFTWSRESGETRTEGCATVLLQVHCWLGDVVREDRELRPALAPLVPMLEWFARADAAAQAADGLPRWTAARARQGRVTLLPALPAGSGDPRADDADTRLEAYRDDPAVVSRLVGEARVELAAGRPAFALVLGSELHWLDRPGRRDEARELLVGAYRALGRDALAAIVEAHYAAAALP